MGILWAWARSRGRRDFIIVRVNLVRPPRFSMDVRDQRGWTGEPDAAAVGTGDPGAEDGRRTRDWGGGPLAVAGRLTDEAVVESAWRRISAASGGVWRLTVQPVVPHVELHVRPPLLGRVGAEALLTPIHDLGHELAER